MNKLTSVCFAAIGLFLLLVFSAQAQEKSVLDLILRGCDQEIKAHCKDVAPDQGNDLSSHYAHSGKISTKCEFALYGAAIQLERVVAELSYTLHECSEEVDTHCTGIEVGGGRLLECLEENELEVSTRCKKALDEVELN